MTYSRGQDGRSTQEWLAWCTSVESIADELVLLARGEVDTPPSDFPVPPGLEVPESVSVEVSAALARLRYAVDAASSRLSTLRVHAGFADALGPGKPTHSVDL